MIKNAELAMVNAATFALDYQEKKSNADVDEIIKKYMVSPGSDIKNELKIYSIAAINEVLKLKRDRINRGKTNKQLIQMFVNSLPEFYRKIKDEGY